MGLHDRTADRESHTHAAGFGGEEGVEQPIRILGGDPDAAIRHTYEHSLFLVLAGSDQEFAWPIRDGLHGFNTIYYQVDDYLLKFDPISQDRGESRYQLHAQRHLMAGYLALHQPDGLPDDVVDIEWHLLNVGFFREPPDAPDHLTRAIAVFDNPFHRATCSVQVGSSAVQPAQTGLRVGNDAGERLIHFMADGSCQFAQSRHARYVREFHLGFEETLFAGAQLLFRPLALADIATHVPDIYRLASLRVVDPKGRIVDRDWISGLEMAETHLPRPGTLLQHRRPEDGVHERTVLGEHVVKSPPRFRFFQAVQSDHFQAGFVQIDRRPSFEVGNRHKFGSLLNQ